MPQVEQRRSGMRSEHLLPTDVGRRQRGVSGDSDSDSDDEYGAAARSEDGDGDERRRLAQEVLLGDSEATSRLLEERLYLVVGATGEPSSVSLGAAALGGSTLGGPNDIGERYEILCDSPLHAAARGDDVDTARLLLAAGGDVGAVNVDRATPVHVAARYGHSGVLALLLLSDGRAQVDSVDVDRWTPLHHAAFNGHAECGRLLLEGGATKAAREVTAGDITADGGIVRCAVKTVIADGHCELVRLPSGLLLTLWHPVKVGGEWCFPAEIGVVDDVPCDAVFSYVVEKAPTTVSGDVAWPYQSEIVVDGTISATLAHGILGQDKISHPFFGTAAIVDALSQCEGWASGLVTFQSNAAHQTGFLLRESATSLVAGLDASRAVA